MYLRIRPLLILTLLLACLSGRAHFSHDDAFLRIDSRIGLSQNNVKSIVQDSYGFMWFGTKNGLCRYDGRTLQQFRVIDQQRGTSNQNVSALAASPGGVLWVGTDRGVFRYDISSDRFTQIDLAASDGARMTNWVSNIIVTRHGEIWMLLPEEGLFRLAPDGKKLSHYLDSSVVPNRHFSCLCITDDGTLWVSGWNVGLYRYDAKKDLFVFENQDTNGRSLMDIQANTICAQGDSITIASQNGLLFFYDYKRALLHDNTLQDFSHTIVRNALTVNNHVFVGTYDGLYDLNLTANNARHFTYERSNDTSISDNIIYTTFADRQGGIWIGTMFGGVSYASHKTPKFRAIEIDTQGNRLSSERIREMDEDDYGYLWITTEDRGLNRIDLRNGHIDNRIGQLGFTGEEFTTTITHHNGTIFVGINKLGIKTIDTQTGHTQMFRNENIGLPQTATAYSIMFDNNHRMWVGTDWGVYRSTITGSMWQSSSGNPNNSAHFKGRAVKEIFSLEPVDGLQNVWVYDLHTDRKGNVWIASMGSGLYHLDVKSGKIHHWNNHQDNQRSLSSDCVSSIFEDHKGNIWLSTDRGGICRYVEKTDDFERFSREEGLSDDVAYAILEDRRGNLWFGTNNGLQQFNPQTGETHLFHTQHGLPGNQFNYKSAHACSNGQFYIGGIHGLVTFDGNQTNEKTVADRDSLFYFTRLWIDGTEASPDLPESPLRQSILKTNEITLPSGSSNLTLEVALLSFANAKTTTYAYYLEPANKTWTTVPDGIINFANLAAGTYLLRVRAINLGNDADFVEKTLRIHVLPSPWFSSWAIALYLLLAALLLALAFRIYKKRKDKQFFERQHLFEVEKEKEMNQKKVQFFTEIAHEIRTPLTLINGPLEIVAEADIRDDKVRKNIAVMKHNTQRLLNLVSQLLDFQRVGASELTWQTESVNVNDLLHETIERFEPSFAIRQKKLTMQATDADIIVQTDREALTKVISNLINNALKYGKQECIVKLQKSTADSLTVVQNSENELFTLSVWSDGESIPQEYAEHIFEPFVQFNGEQSSKFKDGVGIGLPLSRSLAERLGGTLCLAPTDGHLGNEFRLTLPLQPKTSKNQDLKYSNNQLLKNSETLTDNLFKESKDQLGFTILLVEDDIEIRQFVSERLSENFIVESAANGQEAIDIINATHIDLIITDAMMPIMNGIELCRHIKEDIDLSHIPVIFLTAKNDLDSKLSALRAGAEGYVEKPFSCAYLCQLVTSILSNRQKEREAFAKHPFFPIKNMQMSHEDEELMQKAIEVINKHLSDETFNVEAMADAMCMSRSSLLRKIKQLFDMPPLDFIRLIRLKRAAVLIQEGKYRISEISEMVGFANHSYFSKLFLRQFGVTPRNFEEQVRGKSTACYRSS